MLRPLTPRTHQPAGRRWRRTTTTYGPVWGSRRRPSPYLWRKPTSPARAPVDRKGPATMFVMPSWLARNPRAVATARAASREGSGFLGGVGAGGVVGVDVVAGSPGAAAAGLAACPAGGAAIVVGSVGLELQPASRTAVSAAVVSSARTRRMVGPLRCCTLPGWKLTQNCERGRSQNPRDRFGGNAGRLPIRLDQATTAVIASPARSEQGSAQRIGCCDPPVPGAG
jgi:hypothetical protein